MRCDRYVLLLLGMLLVLSPYAFAQNQLSGQMLSGAEETGVRSTDPVPWVPMETRISELDESHIAFISDGIGWSDITPLLESIEDITYDIINSVDLADTDLDQYMAVFTNDCQWDDFYVNLNGAMDQIEAYVDDGGWFVMLGANNSHNPYWELWDGTTYNTNNYGEMNYIIDDQHPITFEQVNPEGNSANHGTIVDYPDDAHIIIAYDEGGDLPVLLEYDHGRGHVIVCTNTTSFLWGNGNPGDYILPNTITYAAFHPTWGTLMGWVANTNDLVVPGAEVTVWNEANDEWMATVYTDEDGEYIVAETLLEGTYTVTAFAPGYLTSTVTELTVLADDTTDQNFTLQTNAGEVQISGTVYSADTPDTPVEGITVSIPVLDISTETDANGAFDFGDQPTGTYLITMAFDPAGSEGYHLTRYVGTEVSAETMPIELYANEVLAPTSFTISVGSEELTLNWEPPTNHPVEEVAMLTDQIEALDRAIATVQQHGNARELAKIADLEQRKFQLQNLQNAMIRAEENGDELDDISDFIGYRCKLIYPNGMSMLTDRAITGTSYTFGDLANGSLYSVAVAADYGYGDDYLVFTDTLSARPLPTGDLYIVGDAGFEWIEIIPDNGGDGTLGLGFGDDELSGELSIAPLSFEFFGEEYSSFWVCSNGWFCFLEPEWGNIWVELPGADLPNATVCVLDGDHHCGETGDGMGIWYLVDEENDRVVIQYYFYPLGYPDYRFSLEAILDCESGSIRIQYQEADNWTANNSNGIGIENGDGDVAFTYPIENITDGCGIAFRSPDWDWGGINGVVTDLITGDPVVGGSVMAHDADGEVWGASTDENGFYTVLVDRDAGPWDLTFSATGYSSETYEDVTIEGEEFDTTVDMELLPAGTISGTILNLANGNPVPNATVTVESSDGERWDRTTDEEGYYEFVREFDLDDEHSISMRCVGYVDQTDDGYTFAEDEYFITADFDLEPLGTIQGTVTDEDGGIVENAMLTLTDSEGVEYTETSDATGWYEFLRVLDCSRTFDLEVVANQCDPNTDHTDLAFGHDSYYITQDVVMNWVSPETPPVLISEDQYYDNGVSVNVMPPGFVGTLMYMSYDDGEMMNATYWTPNSEDMNWAVPYTIDGEGILLQGEIRLTHEDDENYQPGPWPDGEHDPVVCMVWANGDNNLPGELLYTSEEITTSADEPWAIYEPAVLIDGTFWIGLYVVPGHNTSEAICADGEMDDGFSHLYCTDNGWEDGWDYWMGGDPMFRAWVLAFNANQEVAAAPDFPQNPLEYNRDMATFPVNANNGMGVSNNMHDGPNHLRPGVYSRAGLTGGGELDEFTGYYFYKSTDGTNWEQVNEDVVTEDEIPYLIEYGSQYESDITGDAGQHVYYRVTALNVEHGEDIESDPTDDVDTWFYMPPASPGNAGMGDIDHDRLEATVTWDAVTTNEDGTDIVDLEGYLLYRDGVQIADLGPNATSYDDEVTDAGYYTYQVIAYDEVPNFSMAADVRGDDGFNLIRIGNAPYWTSFEPDQQVQQDQPFNDDGTAWQLGEPTGGPGSALDGDYVFATTLTGPYNTNEDEYLTSQHGWAATGETSVLLMYKHWRDYAWGDGGYNLQCSTDEGNSWEIIQPVGGYNYENLWFMNEPGWTQPNEGAGWERMIYDLTNYVAEADSFYLRFHHGSSDWQNGYYGVAIDDFELWGVYGLARGCFTGVVMDADDEPMENAFVYISDYPTLGTYTDATGYYFLRGIPADDTLDILVEYPCYWTGEVTEIEFLDGDTLEINFTNQSGRPLVFPDGEINTSTLEVIVNLNNQADSTGSTSFDLESIGTGVLDWNSYVWVIPSNNVTQQTESSGKEVTAGPRSRDNGRMMRKTTSSSTDPSTLSFSTPGIGPVQAAGELDELFDYIFTLDVGSLTMNDGLVGVAVLEDGIFVTGVDIDGMIEGENYLYEFTSDGNPVAARAWPDDVIGNNGGGPLDLAYNRIDEKLYGGNNNGDIYSFNPDMTEVTWEANVGIWPMALAIDPDEGKIYAIQSGSGFVVYDIESGNTANLNLDDDMGATLGLAYNPIDEDGYTIWALSQDEHGEGGIIHRYNPETFEWDTDWQVIYEADAGSAGGMEITRGYNSARYDIATLIQGSSDIIDVWEGYIAPLSWLYLTPSEGQIQPSETQTITVEVDVRAGKAQELGFEPNSEISAEIVLQGPYWCSPPLVDLMVIFVDIDVDETMGEMPMAYALHQNYPNPFNPLTSIHFDLVDPQNVQLTVYNVMGQEVTRLVDNRRMEAGFHSVSFDANNLASGVYFYQIKAGQFTDLKRMVLVK